MRDSDDDDGENSKITGMILMIFMIGQSLRFFTISLLSRGREDEKVHSLADFTPSPSLNFGLEKIGLRLLHDRVLYF